MKATAAMAVARNTDPLPCVIPVAMPEAAELVSTGTSMFSCRQASLFAMSDKLPGSRVLDGRFPLTGREAGTAYVRKFSENVKAEGLIRSAVEKAGVRGAVEE